MAVTDITQGGVAAIAATASTTSAPSGATDGFRVPPSDSGFAYVRILIAYSGTVSAINITMWTRDRGTGTWYRDSATDDVVPLSPGGASAVNESRVWRVSPGDEVYWTITAISGGGTAAVKAQGVPR